MTCLLIKGSINIFSNEEHLTYLFPHLWSLSDLATVPVSFLACPISPTQSQLNADCTLGPKQFSRRYTVFSAGTGSNLVHDLESCSA